MYRFDLKNLKLSNDIKNNKLLPKIYIGSNTYPNKKSTVLFRGVNIVNKIAPYTYGSDFFKPSFQPHFNFIREMGTNFVRLGVCWAGVEPVPGKYNDTYIFQIFNTINELKNKGIYTLFDFHSDGYADAAGGWGFPDWAILNPDEPVSELGFPNFMYSGAIVEKNGKPITIVSDTFSNTFDLFWENKPYKGKGIQDRYIDMLLYVMQKINNNEVIRTSVVGIDVINEPWPGNLWKTTVVDPHQVPNLTDPGFNTWKRSGTKIPDEVHLTPFYHKFVNKYSKYFKGSDFILFLQPFITFSGGCPSSLNFNKILSDVKDMQICFNYHNFTLNPNRVFNNVKFVMNSYKAKNNNRLLEFMTEFGAGFFPPNLPVTLEISNERKLSYSFWNYVQKLDFEFSVNLPSAEIQNIYTKPDEPFNLEYINFKTKVDFLSQPFPASTPGDIINFSNDLDSKTFNLKFTLKNLSMLKMIVSPYYFINYYNIRLFRNGEIVLKKERLNYLNLNILFDKTNFKLEDTILLIIN